VPDRPTAWARPSPRWPPRAFLIIGSGSITHNLGDYQAAWQNGGQTPAYVREFADWLAAQTTA
jgi:4,5-DOPA dioxygenase extradiol